MGENNTGKVLSRGDLVALAVGNVIGGGIMSLTGIAIGITGRSIVLALVVCSVMVLISALPQFFSASAIRMNGGFYTQAALFGGKYFSGLYATVFVSFFFGAALYSLSFADYVSSFIPGVDMKLVGLLLLTVIFALNILGVKVAAKVQYAMVILLIIALLAFAGFGMSHVQPGFTEAPDWMLDGFGGVMSAAALMSFATTGSAFIVNFSKQCKNPTKDIPIAILISTGVVLVTYILVSIVAAGVFPVEQVAGQSLAITAAEVLPYPIYLFFIICGAMFALVTSLNALFGWVTGPLVQASKDGWFPKFLGNSNKRFGSPHWMLLIIYVLAAAIILFDWQIGAIANVGNFLSNCLSAIICIALVRMPKVVPQAWEKSIFKINNTAYTVLCILGAVMSIVFCYFLAIELSGQEVVGTFIYLAIAVIYPIIRLKVGSGITIDTEYEEV